MDGVRVSEQVVQVTKNLLVGTHEEHAQVIRLLAIQLVYRKMVREIARRDKIINLPVRITSNILNCCRFRWLLVQTGNRYDREYLVDRP